VHKVVELEADTKCFSLWKTNEPHAPLKLSGHKKPMENSECYWQIICSFITLIIRLQQTFLLCIHLVLLPKKNPQRPNNQKESNAPRMFRILQLIMFDMSTCVEMRFMLFLIAEFLRSVKSSKILLQILAEFLSMFIEGDSQ
jgi:hypothetical protein